MTGPKTKIVEADELAHATYATKNRLLVALVFMLIFMLISGLPNLFGYDFLTIIPVAGFLLCFLFLALSIVSTLGYKILDKYTYDAERNENYKAGEFRRVGAVFIWNRFIIREYI